MRYGTFLVVLLLVAPVFTAARAVPTPTGTPGGLVNRNNVPSYAWFFDDFEESNASGNWGNCGSVGAPDLTLNTTGGQRNNSGFQWSGRTSLEIQSPPTAGGFGEACKFLPWMLGSGTHDYGFSVWFDVPESTSHQVSYVFLGMEVRQDFSDRYLAWVRFLFDGTIQVYDSTATDGTNPVTIGSLGAFNTLDGWHFLQVVISFTDTNGKASNAQYQSIIADDQSFTHAQIGDGNLQFSGSRSSYREIQFFANVNHLKNVIGANSMLLIDDAMGFNADPLFPPPVANTASTSKSNVSSDCPLSLCALVDPWVIAILVVGAVSTLIIVVRKVYRPRRTVKVRPGVLSDPQSELHQSVLGIGG